jgi:hypothetical protein
MLISEAALQQARRRDVPIMPGIHSAHDGPQGDRKQWSNLQ